MVDGLEVWFVYGEDDALPIKTGFVSAKLGVGASYAESNGSGSDKAWVQTLTTSSLQQLL